MKGVFEEIRVKIAQLSQKDKSILTLVITVVMVVLFTQYGFKSKLDSISKLKSEIMLKSQDLAMAKTKNVSLLELQKEYKELSEKINSFETKIPQETKVDVFISNLTKTAAGYGVTIKSIEAGKITKEGEYVRFSTEINLLSQPDKLIEFLDALAAMSRLISVKEFNVKSEGSLSEKVNARLIVAAYSMK